MTGAANKAMGWVAIVAIMVATGVVVGLLLGLAGRLFGLSLGVTTAGIGAAVGLVGALLVARRREALSRRPPAPTALRAQTR